MYRQARKSKTIRFHLKPAKGVGEVRLAGSFSDWKPVGMARQKDGAFAASVPLGPGIHQYKFIVDGVWITDPDNDFRAPNPFGSANSVATVG